MGFKQQESFEKRAQLSERIREQYPDLIPVIVEPFNERGNNLNLSEGNSKFLIKSTDTVHKLIYSVRQKIDNLSESEALFLFCTVNSSSIIAPVTSTMGSLYDKYKDEDGLLYFTVSREQVYG